MIFQHLIGGRVPILFEHSVSASEAHDLNYDFPPFPKN